MTRDELLVVARRLVEVIRSEFPQDWSLRRTVFHRADATDAELELIDRFAEEIGDEPRGISGQISGQDGG